METPADQTDVIAANERLMAERDEARTQLATVTAERDTARARVTELETLLAEAGEARNSAGQLLSDANQRLNVVTAERDRLAGVDRDFNRRLAAELAKHGIRLQAIAPSANAGPSATPAPVHKDVPAGSFLAQNLTALCLAVKGA